MGKFSVSWWRQVPGSAPNKETTIKYVNKFSKTSMNFQKLDSHAVWEGVNNLLANVQIFKEVFSGLDFSSRKDTHG